MTVTSKVKLLCYNILEEGTVVVTGEDSGYPKSSLYDRSLGFYCKYSTAGAFYVTVSGNSLAVDALIVEGHNLNGVACYWQWSDNGSSWTDAIASWTQSGNSQILKQLSSPLTHAYWRFYTGSVAFQATELFMGRAISVPVIWDNNPSLKFVDDTEWSRTYGGVDHCNRIGPKRRFRHYITFMDRTNYPIDTLRSDFEYLDDFVKAPYLIDHEGNCFLSKFDGGLPEEEHWNEGMLTVDFSFMEIPG